MRLRKLEDMGEIRELGIHIFYLDVLTRNGREENKHGGFIVFSIVYCNKPNVSKFGVILEGKRYPIF